MRIFVWHGYLLGGTGSNIYARQLSREWSREGHDVTVFSQEPRPERFDLGGAEAVRPDVGGLLPVFVLDRYEGYEVKLVQDCSRDLLDAWVEANAAAIRDRGPADLVFSNHVLLGGPVGAASGSSYVVKAHGSELEYSMRANEELSARELEVLAMLAEGLSKRETADRLFLSFNTVHSHVRAIYRKLDVGSRSDALIRAREAGLIE